MEHNINSILILHGKPQPNQFFHQPLFFTLRFTYLHICMLLQVAQQSV
jgi:hypothetical protein